MRKVLSSFAVLGALAAAMPATAATVVFNTGGTNTTASSKTFAGSDGTNVKVTAFSIDATGKIVAGTLGQWSGGLGIQNSTGDDSHTTDNSGWSDFFLLSFSNNVRVGDATFTTNFSYNDGTCCLRDTDATVGAGLLGAPWASDLSGLVGQNESVLNALGLVSSNSSLTTATQTRNINTTGRSGTLWLVGASFNNTDNVVDGFKFKQLTYTVATAPVPEPSTWALLILGFGAVGATLRKRKQQIPAIA